MIIYFEMDHNGKWMLLYLQSLRIQISKTNTKIRIRAGNQIQR